VQQLNVDDVKISLASIRRTLIAVLVIGCSWSSVGAVAAHADYYWHHHHFHHRQWYQDRHHHRYYHYN